MARDRKEYYKQYYREHKEYFRDYYHRNKQRRKTPSDEQVRAYNKEYYQKHKEEIKARNHKYYCEHSTKETRKMYNDARRRKMGEEKYRAMYYAYNHRKLKQCV